MISKKDNGSKIVKIYNNDIVDAINASALNDIYCCKLQKKNKGLLYKIKYFLWIITLILFSPYTDIKTKKFICVTSELTDKRLKEYSDNGEYFKFANTNKSFNDIRNNLSVFSPYNFFRRIYLLFNGLSFYLKNRNSLKGNWHYTTEYYVISFYIIDKKIEEIISAGVYERYCTFLGYLGKSMKIKVVGIQDGAIIDIDPPKKVYCNEMYVFDEFEKRMFRRIAMNENCIYHLTGFKSTLQWKEFEKKDKTLVGIASQDWHTEKTIDIIDNLSKILDPDRFQVVVFPHYRETIEQYEKVQREHPNIIFESGPRYNNLDILITFYSTIVYDFWSVNKTLPIICQYIKGFKPAYYNRNNVKVVKNTEDVGKAVLECFQ